MTVDSLKEVVPKPLKIKTALQRKILSNLERFLSKEGKNKLEKEVVVSPEVQPKEILLASYRRNEEEIVFTGAEGKYSVIVNMLPVYETDLMHMALNRFYAEIEKVITKANRNLDLSFTIFGEEVKRINSSQIIPILKSLGNHELEEKISNMDMEDLGNLFIKSEEGGWKGGQESSLFEGTERIGVGQKPIVAKAAYSPDAPIERIGETSEPIFENQIGEFETVSGGGGNKPAGSSGMQIQYEPESSTSAESTLEKQTAGGAVQMISGLQSGAPNKSEIFEKAKVYIQPEKGESAPEGIQIKTGPKGGTYYESEEIKEGEWSQEEISSKINGILSSKDRLSSEDILALNFLSSKSNNISDLIKILKSSEEILYEKVNAVSQILNIDLDKGMKALSNLYIGLSSDQNLHVGLDAELRGSIKYGVELHFEAMNLLEFGKNIKYLEEANYFGDDDIKSKSNFKREKITFWGGFGNIDKFSKTYVLDTDVLPKTTKDYIRKIDGKEVKSIELIQNIKALYNTTKYGEMHDYLYNEWLSSSDSEGASVLKAAVADVFGGNIYYSWKYPGKTPIQIRENMRNFATDIDFNYGEVEEYVKVQKNLTKELLGIKYPGKTMFKLYRGTNNEGVINVVINGIKMIARSNSLSSWTTKFNIAKTFGTHVLEIEVPVERIWSSFLTHSYSASEHEIIVLGLDGIEVKSIFEGVK